MQTQNGFVENRFEVPPNGATSWTKLRIVSFPQSFRSTGKTQTYLGPSDINKVDRNDSLLCSHLTW